MKQAILPWTFLVFIQ